MGDVNYVHPFREGNGRTQLYFLEQLAEQAGHPIDLRRLDPQRWIAASRATVPTASYSEIGILNNLERSIHIPDAAFDHVFYRSVTTAVEADEALLQCLMNCQSVTRRR